MPGTESIYDTFIGYSEALSKICGKIEEFSGKVGEQIARNDPEGFKKYSETLARKMERVRALSNGIGAKLTGIGPEDYLSKIGLILEFYGEINSILGDALYLYGVMSRKSYLATLIQNFSETYASNVMQEITGIKTDIDKLIAKMGEDSAQILEVLYAQINKIKNDGARLREYIGPIVGGPINNQFSVPILRYIMSNYDIFMHMPEIVDQIEGLKDEALIEGLGGLGLSPIVDFPSKPSTIIEKLGTACGLFPDTPSMNKEALFDYIEGTSSGKVVARANVLEIHKYFEGKPGFEYKMSALFDRAKTASAPKLSQIIDYTTIAHYNAIRELNTAKLPIPGDGIIKTRWDAGAQYTIIIETIDGEDWRALSLRPGTGPVAGDNFFIPTVKIAALLAPHASARAGNYHRIISHKVTIRAITPGMQNIVDGYKKATLPKRDPEGLKEKISAEMIELAGARFTEVMTGAAPGPKQMLELAPEGAIGAVLGKVLLNELIDDTEYKITQVIKIEKIRAVFISGLMKALSGVKLPKAFSGPLSAEQNKSIILGHFRDALKQAIAVIDAPPSLLREYDYSIKDYLYTEKEARNSIGL